MLSISAEIEFCQNKWKKNLELEFYYNYLELEAQNVHFSRHAPKKKKLNGTCLWI